MSYKLLERAVILAKVEGAYGVDPVPVATDAIVVGLPDLSINGEKVERNATSATFSPFAHRIGIKDLEISFPVDIRGLGSAYGAAALPEISPLLRACSFGEVVDATPSSENVVYSPVSDAIESCTIYFYEDGILYKALGCRGDVEFTMESGKMAVANFTFQALYTKPADDALITPTYDDISVLPPIVFSGGLTIGAYSPIVSRLMLKMGNAMAKRLDVNNANGFREIIINDREPAGALDPEMDDLATKDFFQEWEDGTAQALAMQVGSVQYNKFDFACPKTVIDSLAMAEREKMRTLDLPLVLTRNTGDDELVLTFD